VARRFVTFREERYADSCMLLCFAIQQSPVKVSLTTYILTFTTNWSKAQSPKTIFQHEIYASDEMYRNSHAGPQPANIFGTWYFVVLFSVKKSDCNLLLYLYLTTEHVFANVGRGISRLPLLVAGLVTRLCSHCIMFEA